MCSRYFMEEHVEENAASSLPFAIHVRDGRDAGVGFPASGNLFRARDIHPSEEAPAIAVLYDAPEWRRLRWGYPVSSAPLKRDGREPGLLHPQQPAPRENSPAGYSPQVSGLVINARAESLLEKPMFRRGAQSRRIILPASGFYEWNAQKEKNIFRSREGRLLYMAGIFDLFPDGERFVIVTTAANDSMRPVHGRMPLILDPDQVEDWLFNSAATEEILCSTPALLNREMPYEQMSLF